MNEELKQLIISSSAYPHLKNKSGHFLVDDTIGISLLFSALFSENPDNYTIICSNIYIAQKIANLISSFIGSDNVLLFPCDEFAKSEILSASKEFLAQRLFVLNELINKKKKILIIHSTSLIYPLSKPEEFKKACINFKVGDQINLEDVKTILLKNGYQRVNRIDQSMEFASRGDILDIFSIGYENPIRIELFDDEIESISLFDIATQVSTKTIDEFVALPSSDQLYSDEELSDAITEINLECEKSSSEISFEMSQKLRETISDDIDLLRTRSSFTKINKYFRTIKKNHVCNVLNYVSSPFVFIENIKQCEISTNFTLTQACDYSLQAFKEGKQLKILKQYLDKVEIPENIRVLQGNSLQESDNLIKFDVKPVTISKSDLSSLGSVILSFVNVNDKTTISLLNKTQLEMLKDVLDNDKIEYEILKEFGLPKGKLGLVIYNLEEGFELTERKICFLTQNELFGVHNRSVSSLNKFKEGTILRSFEDLKEGDFVVHEYYGIGKYLDIQTIEIDGIHRDFLHIQYAGTDVLYVPLNQFRLVRKYSGREGTSPKLSRLSNGDWEKTKSKIKERINLLADRLYQLYSERAQSKGFAFGEDDEFQQKFESEFSYDLTTDQETALSEIKKDMQSDVVMDRLLCGDVGFGKTEVAFRAAFKAILSGKQVVFLCPTTLLARQHYELALQRFSNYGVHIAHLSRLVSGAQQRDFIKKIGSGEVDLIIGTHRLLAKEIVYKNLGLLIIDEEQRFGVEQKEKIKGLKNNVDVLSLSATPIPRTLQLSLLNVRPVSQITTPPQNRYPIQTYVCPFDEVLAKELIERELGRNGQVFYVHNVVSTITSLANRLQRAIPQAKIGVIHGQMDKDLIEDTMIKFYSGEINLLIATSIIENGIDIPNANLILIEDADKFGLAQLYQIKGRVGRGDRIAYAYLFYQPMKQINENAIKRLKAIQDFAELGSGFKIAQRDLMIRGAGDILGPEQAGFIDSVGLDLYLKLLNEVIEERKTGVQATQPKPVKMFNIDAYIPETYSNKSDKIELYQEIENVKNHRELQELWKKIRDIYGRLPQEVELLLRKRKIDLALEGDAFEEALEYPNAIEIRTSKAFSNISGIGVSMFEAFEPILSSIQLLYVQKNLRIRINKVNDWMKTLETTLYIIQKLFNQYRNKILENENKTSK